MGKKSLNPLDNINFDLPSLEEVTEGENNNNDSQRTKRQKQSKKSRAVRQTNLLLPIDQLTWIDKKHAEANTKSPKSFRKTAIVRAVFDAVMTVKIDLSGVTSEEEIKDRVIASMSQIHG